MLESLSGTAMNEPLLAPFEAVEFELALDLQDPTRATFDDCVRAAAAVVGGEMLFEMPADGGIEDASRIAAVRLRHPERDRIFFALLGDDGATIRVASKEEVGELFHGFARAFVGVLERIRDDLPAGVTRPAGTA